MMLFGERMVVMMTLPLRTSSPMMMQAAVRIWRFWEDMMRAGAEEVR